MKIRFALPVFAALALSAMVGAQAAPKAAEAGASKVAVIDFQGAIAGTAEGKQAAAQLQSEFAPRQSDLANISKQINDLQTRLTTGQNTLSDDEKGHIQTQINQLTQQGQRKQQELQEDENAREQDLVNQIGSKMVQLVDKYAGENGYTIVIDGSSQSSTVVYAAPSANITEQIISLYDSSYPVKGGSAPSSSSAPRTTPRPSTGTTPKPQP
jgi:outer membrane protein